MSTLASSLFSVTKTHLPLPFSQFHISQNLKLTSLLIRFSSSFVLQLLNHLHRKQDEEQFLFGHWVSPKSFRCQEKTSNRVSFGPDIHDESLIFIKQVAGMGAAESRNGGARVSAPKETKFSSSRILRTLKSKMEKAITVVSMRRESSGRVSASSFRRSKSVSDSADSHRAEAIEDCVEFFNSASSLPRSNSVSGYFLHRNLQRLGECKLSLNQQPN